MLDHPLSAVVFGVLLSLIVVVSFATENPARIPLRLVFLRTLPGLVLFLASWVLISYLAYSLFILKLPWVSGLDSFSRWVFAAVVGLVMPILIRTVKNNLIGRRLAQAIRFLMLILQFFDEITILYLSTVINREERKVAYALLEGDEEIVGRIIDKLFEFHLVGIAQDRADKSKEADKERVLNVFKVRNRPIKIKLLLRYLGYGDFFGSIGTLAKEPQRILPTWPKDDPDRRHRPNRRKQDEERASERRCIPFGRRKLDSPYLRDFILDQIGQGSGKLEK